MCTSHVSNILKTLPLSPGVYQFFNASGDIIYIGKAKKLKNRVKSYFNGTTKLNFAKKKMLAEIKDIKYIMTESEIEALILENNLIKKHQPRYNILLKDDKNFLYIRISDDLYPKITKTRIAPRSRGKLGGKYFGPYLSGESVIQILKIIKKIYGYGVGKHHFFKKNTSYTLDPYIFKGNIDEKENDIKKIYQEKIEEITKFLSGDTKNITEQYKDIMFACAKKHQFEEAQRYKEMLAALEDLKGYQVVQTEVRGNFVAIQFLEKYDTLFAGVIIIEDSKLISYESYEFKNIEMEDLIDLKKILLEEILVLLYTHHQGKNFRFLLSSPIDYPNLGFQYEIPEIGPKYDIMKLCYKNIYQYAQKTHIAQLSTKSFSKQTMKNILHILGYNIINDNIVFECNDISHLSGSHTVASRSIIENGKKNPKKYKKFRLKTLQQGTINDFASMQEIIHRRLLEIHKLGNTPDLIVIDGGKGQISAVMKTVQDFQKNNFIHQESKVDISGGNINELGQEVMNKQKIFPQIVSIAKREEELFIPGNKNPIILKKDSPELRLIQTIRDEAHRFAITFNRSSRNTVMKQSLLEAIPGIGPKTRKKIIKIYGSVSNLKKQNISEVESKLGKHITEILDTHGLV